MADIVDSRGFPLSMIQLSDSELDDEEQNYVTYDFERRF